MNTESTLPFGLWLALFPISFLIHFAEEYWAAGGYVEYLYRLRGVRMSVGRFLFFQGVGFAWFAGLTALAYALDFPAFAILLLSGFIVCNGISHTITAIWDRHYGPGLIASIVLWIPLGAVSIVLLYGQIPTWCWALATGAGIAFNGAVAVGTMMGGKVNRGTAASR